MIILKKNKQNCTPFQNRLGSILPFRKYLRTVSEVFGAFWDILTQFVKTGSSHPQMDLLDKFYTQFNQFL